MFSLALITFFSSLPVSIIAAMNSHPVTAYFLEGLVLLLQDHLFGLLLILFQSFLLAYTTVKMLGYEIYLSVD